MRASSGQSAFVTLNGIRSAFADSTGAFAFDSLAPGDHMLEMTHAVLDSMGKMLHA